MSREEYRNLWKNVEPRKKHQEELIEKLTNKQDEVFTMDQKKNRKPLYGTIAAFALLAVILVGNGLSEKNPDTETPGGESLIVKYSDLLFEDPVLVDAPEAVGELGGKIMPFTEDLLSESAAFIKGTVTGIAFEQEKVLYTLVVTRVFGEGEGVEEGKSITLINELYTYTSLAGSVEKLQVDRTYLLPLTLREEEGKEVYSVLYPFAPQIQMTKDGKYLYPDHYVSLDHSEAKTVEMDPEEGSGYYGTMKLREDGDFEKDLEELVKTYSGR